MGIKLNEREKLDKDLRESPDVLASIIGSVMDAIIAIDEAQRIVLFNPAAENIFGCPANEAIGSSVERFIPQRFRAGHSERVRRFVESGVTNRTFYGLGTLWGLRATGEEFPIEASISKFEFGGKKFFTVVIRDITERKMADESRSRLAAIVESSEDSIIGTDVSGTVTEWNKGAERLWGYLASEAIGKNVSFLRAADRSKEGQGNLKKVINGGVVTPYETVLKRKDGTLVDVSLRISPIVDPEGRVVGASGIARDITEWKRAEVARSRHSAIVESSEDAIISKNLDGLIENWNAGAERIFGYTEAEAVGQPITIIIPSELQDEEKGILERLRAGERIEQYETVRVTKAGKKVDVSLSVSPLKDSTGRVVGASKIARDITERKRAEEALRMSEERLRMGQWAAHIGTFDLNIRTGVDVWTPETEALYGLPPGGFGGTWTDFENLIHPDDRERVIKSNHEMMRTGQPTEGEWRVVWPDGSIHWIAGRAQVFMDESGEPSRMLGVNIDITERKQADEALVAMTRKLVEAQEQERARIARELHDDISQRLAMLAIEIEQVDALRPETPTVVRDWAHGLSKRAKEISADVQLLSHELHSSRLEYLGIVGGMKSWCNEFGERRGIEIEFNPDVQSSVSPEISLCLFRVLQEALHNAAKHSGVKRVDVQLREESGEIQLTVSDLGKGFDVAAAMLDRGLGVTSMRERVRLVGGTIAIDSKPLGGTTIHVRVPLGTERSFQRAAG